MTNESLNHIAEEARTHMEKHKNATGSVHAAGVLRALDELGYSVEKTSKPALKKTYDYWLLVYINRLDEEIHEPACFQKGIHPKAYCEEVLKQDFENGNGKIKCPYKGYKIYPMSVQNAD